MGRMRRANITIGIPALAAVVAAAVAGLWVTTPPRPGFQPRETWRDPVETATTGPAIPVGPPGVLTAFAGVAPGEDIAASWPQFLGPHRNARVTDGAALAEGWPEGGPKVLWSIELGHGHAGAAVRNGRVYILDYHEDQDPTKQGDMLRCFSLADGREMWRYWYCIPLKDDHGISRTVPAVTDRYVVTMGPACHILCVDAMTGKYQWGMDPVKYYGSQVPSWHASQCPLIDGDRAVFATGGKALMVAFALSPAAPGQPHVLWETPNPFPDVRNAEGKIEDKGLHITHTSIMPMTFKGRRIYVYGSTKGVVGVSDQGKLLWHYGTWRPATNAASPVILGQGRILVSADTGCEILRLKEGPGGGIQVESEAKTQAKVFSSYQQTPVLYKGYLYAVLSQTAPRNSQQIACLDISGPEPKQLWTSGRRERFKWGPYLVADDKILAVHDYGEMTMAKVSPSGYEVLAKAEILPNKDVWAPMALVDGRLLVRDKLKLLCLDLRAR